MIIQSCFLPNSTKLRAHKSISQQEYRYSVSSAVTDSVKFGSGRHPSQIKDIGHVIEGIENGTPPSVSQIVKPLRHGSYVIGDTSSNLMREGFKHLYRYQNQNQPLKVEALKIFLNDLYADDLPGPLALVRMKTAKTSSGLSGEVLKPVFRLLEALNFDQVSKKPKPLAQMAQNAAFVLLSNPNYAARPDIIEIALKAYCHSSDKPPLYAKIVPLIIENIKNPLSTADHTMQNAPVGLSESALNELLSTPSASSDTRVAVKPKPKKRKKALQKPIINASSIHPTIVFSKQKTSIAPAIDVQQDIPVLDDTGFIPVRKRERIYRSYSNDDLQKMQGKSFFNRFRETVADFSRLPNPTPSASSNKGKSALIHTPTHSENMALQSEMAFVPASSSTTTVKEKARERAEPLPQTSPSSSFFESAILKPGSSLRQDSPGLSGQQASGYRNNPRYVEPEKFNNLPDYAKQAIVSHAKKSRRLKEQLDKQAVRTETSEVPQSRVLERRHTITGGRSEKYEYKY